jgi:hypothetical protein
VRGLAESLRGELKGTGVQFSIVYPPDTDTPQLAEENLTKPAETKAITAGAGLWSAHDVARLTLEGVTCGPLRYHPRRAADGPVLAPGPVVPDAAVALRRDRGPGSQGPRAGRLSDP